MEIVGSNASITGTNTALYNTLIFTPDAGGVSTIKADSFSVNRNYADPIIEINYSGGSTVLDLVYYNTLNGGLDDISFYLNGELIEDNPNVYLQLGEGSEGYDGTLSGRGSRTFYYGTSQLGRYNGSVTASPEVTASAGAGAANTARTAPQAGA